MKTLAKFKFCLTRLVMLLLCLWALTPQATADVTIWVQANSAPRLFVFNTSGTCSGTVSGTDFSTYTTWSGALMTKSVTTSDNKTWYYEVFEGLNSASIIFNNGNSGNDNQTSDITGVSGTKYFYSNGSNKYIDLTECKNSSAYCFLETSPTYWEQASARFQVWDGSANVWMTKVGGINGGNSIYLYPKSSAVADGTTFYFKRMSSDGNTEWNSGSALYHIGGYYTNTDWNSVAYQSGSSFGEIVWPEMPAVTTCSFTVNVYDASGAPKVNGTTLSNTTSGTNCQWYTYTYEDTTLPSSVTVESSTGATATLTDPANGQTYYYAWNGYTLQAVSSDYDPAVRHLIHWPEGNQYSTGTNVTPTTTDGINYTYGNITLGGNDWLVFTTVFSNNWNADKESFYGASGNVSIEGASGNGKSVKGQTGIIHVTTAGIWLFTYNIVTNAWTATRTGDLPQNTYTIHVIDYYDEQPYLYAWDSTGDLNGGFPGAQMTTTETSDAGETWYVKSFSTTASTINAIVSLGGDNADNTKTEDITGIAPGDYYIVYNSQTHTYTASTTMPEGKQQAEKNTFTVYVKADAAPYLYAWNPEWHGEWKDPENLMTSTEQPLADGNTWYKVTYETYAESINFLLHNNGSDDNYHQSSNITQTKPVAYYVYDGATKCIETVEPTGKMYVIGQVAGNPWSSTMGKEMTANADNTVFTLNNVQIIAGSTFAFASRMADESLEGDAAWAMLNSYRLTSNPGNGGTFWGVTNAMTDKDNPQALDLRIWNGADKNFRMDETAYYDITVDIKAMTVTIKRRYGALYMFYGDSNSPYWKPNAGVPMFTTDGKTFMLTNVNLKEGDTFQFATQLGDDENTWPANTYRYGANSDGNNKWLVTESQIDVLLENALLQESTNDFKMESGTAGNYRVVVNPEAQTVALYRMAEVLGGKVIIHLEKTSNVTNPKIWAYDKERDVTDSLYIHVDRPSRIEIATNRHALLENEDPVDAKTITTADGRQWWTWEVDKAITDFWFTRNGYDYGSVKTTALTDDDMTDIQWRKAGEVYFTWPTTGAALEEYTRDYYAAAAQEAPECAVMIEGHMYAYFTNTPGWAHVFCHAWNTDAGGNNHDLLTPPSPYEGDPCYPGALCEMVGYDKDGYEVWRIDLTAHSVTQYPNGGILFNNGIDDNHEYEHDMNHDYYTGSGTTAAKEQTGDFAYSTGACYDYCGLIVLGRSLSNIIRNGVVNGPVYTIEDDIVGVWFDPKAVTEIEVDGETHTMYGALYCKDLNNFVTTPYVEKSLQKEGEIDYMLQRTNLMAGKNRYDQSNWVKLTLSTQYPNYETNFKNNPENQKAELLYYVGKVLPAESVHGQLVNNVNPEMRLALHALPTGNLSTNNYNSDPNVFITSNFVGTQECKEGEDEYGHIEPNTYFFVTPKPQEYAEISWAVYAVNDKFYVPKRGYVDEKNQWMNEGNLDGYFPVQWDLMEKPGLVENQVYRLNAIIRLAVDEPSASEPSGVMMRDDQQAYKVYEGTVPYVVSPIEILEETSIITAVNEVNTTKTVRQVRYYNLAGIESSVPFDGVNVVVTTYTDGSKTTAKMLK